MLLLLDRDDVPDEILVLVVDFLQTRTLSQTCRRAWQLLQRRYPRYWVGQQIARRLLDHCWSQGRTLSICLLPGQTVWELMGPKPLPV